MADCLCPKCNKNKNIEAFKKEIIFRTCDECRSETATKLREYIKQKRNIDETFNEEQKQFLSPSL